MTYMRTLVIRSEQPFCMDIAYLVNFCAHERTWRRFRTDPPVICGAGSTARHTQVLEVLILCAVRLGIATFTVFASPEAILDN